jgi:hypothetical protein
MASDKFLFPIMKTYSLLTSLHAADGEPAVAIDSASFEATAMDDAVMTVDAEVGAHLEQPSTPRTTSSPSIAESCKEHLKPMVGMIFDTLTDVEIFTNRMHMKLVSLFMLVSTRSKMRKYYSSGIIIQGKGTERRA